MQRVGVLAWVVSGLLVVGCVASPPGSPQPASSSSGAPAPTASSDSPDAVESPSAEPSIDLSGLDEATRKAISIRTSFGLRRDLAWIRQVAADPTATGEWGTPLLPAEVQEIEDRQARAHRVVPIVQSYAADKVATFGGLWIDQAAGGVVTVSFTDELEHHRQALAKLLGAQGTVAVVQARYAEAPMRALQDRVSQDADWFKTIPAALRSVGYDVIGNALEIEISTANPDIASLISARYGVPLEALKVISDGTGIAMEPWGKIHGRVVDVPEKTLVELSINYHGTRPGADCGSEVGIGLGPAGTFELPCQGGHWIFEAGRTIDDIVARGEVDLAPGGEASVTLRPVAP